MYGIKQASNLVKMIYTSHTYNYFPLHLMVWCQEGCKQIIDLSVRVQPLTPGLLGLLDPAFPGRVEDAWRGGRVLLCLYRLGVGGGGVCLPLVPPIAALLTARETCLSFSSGLLGL